MAVCLKNRQIIASFQIPASKAICGRLQKQAVWLSTYSKMHQQNKIIVNKIHRLQYSITVLQYYSITVLQYYSNITVLQYYSAYLYEIGSQGATLPPTCNFCKKFEEKIWTKNLNEKFQKW